MSDQPLLRCVELGPEDADATVIWMHGLGASGHDFPPVVPHLGLPPESRVRFVFPHAPRIPVTINMGMVMPAWYDILGMDLRTRHDEAGIRSSAEHVERLIERERERGVAAERLVLAGFSQGGALALHCGLRHAERLAGILVLSAYLLLPETTAAERSPANAETPILQCHGTFDPMVAESRGRAARDALRELGYTVEYETWPMQHEVCLEEIQRIGAWLREVLPPLSEESA